MAASAARSLSCRGFIPPPSESLSCLELAFPTNSNTGLTQPDQLRLEFLLRRILTVGVCRVDDGADDAVSSSCVETLLRAFSIPAGVVRDSRSPPPPPPSPSSTNQKLRVPLAPLCHRLLPSAIVLVPAVTSPASRTWRSAVSRTRRPVFIPLAILKETEKSLFFF